MMDEYYLPSKNYPKYEVSNLGNVRNKKTGTVRKQTNRNGYRKIRINNKDVNIHKMVAETFYEGDHTGLQINHKDGNKSNNHVDNLEWVTPSENIKHAFKTGLKHPSGGPTRIKIEDVDTGEVYPSRADCARSINGTSQGIMYSINHDKTYKGHKFRVHKGD